MFIQLITSNIHTLTGSLFLKSTRTLLLLLLVVVVVVVVVVAAAAAVKVIVVGLYGDGMVTPRVNSWLFQTLKFNQVPPMSDHPHDALRLANQNSPRSSHVTSFAYFDTRDDPVN